MVEDIGFEPICILRAKQVFTPSKPIPRVWLRERESNPHLQLMRLLNYRYSIPRLKLAPRVGIEPTMTFVDGLTVRCITSLRTLELKLVWE